MNKKILAIVAVIVAVGAAVVFSQYSGELFKGSIKKGGPVVVSDNSIDPWIIGANQKVVSFRVEAGSKGFSASSFVLKCLGEYSKNTGVSDNDFQLFVGRELLVEGTVGDCLAGHRVQLPEDGVKISANESQKFTLWYDTGAVFGAATGESMFFKIILGNLPIIAGPVLTY